MTHEEPTSATGRGGRPSDALDAVDPSSLGGPAETPTAAEEVPTREVSGGRPNPDKPNIVLIVVDEMRYPREFPAGITSAEGFISTFMPNLYRLLWKPGVKFGNHFTNGTACSPARACFVTGLYPLQQWLLLTRTGTSDQPAPSPALGRAFPTYGKLLQDEGYRTPYAGKWHLSPSLRDGTDPHYLNLYGFQGLTQPDVLGDNGDGYNKDPEIAQTAAQWLSATRPGQQPFCLTASFVNPHDKQFFWAGTEADHYTAEFDAAHETPQRPWDRVPTEDRPRTYGYNATPANWEPITALSSKPSTQAFGRDLQALIWGGATDDPTQTDGVTFKDYAYAQDPSTASKIAQAPFGYWERGLDSYTQMLEMVDEHIGTVVSAVPKEVAENTVFVFMSDHGEYAGAHGFLSGKIASAYDEAFSIPLVVVDPRGKLTRDVDTLRTQLTGSVDLAPMLATIARGDRSWLTGDIGRTYRERLDLVPLLGSATAPGRDSIVMTSSEHPPSALNAGNAPTHIYILRTREYKVAAYARWLPNTSTIDQSSLEYEFYDYSTERGRLELDNTYESDPRAKPAAMELLNRRLPEQLAEPLPQPYQQQSDAAKLRYFTYIAAIDRLTGEQLAGGGLARLTAFGANF